ncbi:hypothetical protein Tco_1315057 [Tanacetum coccineum]
MEDDKEKEDLKQCFEIVQDDEVAIDAIPLATKPAPISLTEKTWKIYGSWLKLRMGIQGQKKAMKECYEKVLLWRLYDSCGIHFMRFEDMHVYMLVEKRYPLTPVTITDMLNKKLASGTKVTTVGYNCLKITTAGRVYADREEIKDLSEKR